MRSTSSRTNRTYDTARDMPVGASNLDSVQVDPRQNLAIIRPPYMRELEESSYGSTPAWSLDGRNVLAKCVKVYDGDTAHFATMMDSGIARIRCRFAGINTAELRSTDAAERDKAQRARSEVIRLIEGKICILQLGEMDKYGRPLAVVWTADQLGAGFAAVTNVNEHLVACGLAMPYDGSGEKQF
jgi:endonuclease YncB( thermonuclease family)